MDGGDRGERIRLFRQRREESAYCVGKEKEQGKGLDKMDNGDARIDEAGCMYEREDFSRGWSVVHPRRLQSCMSVIEILRELWERTQSKHKAPEETVLSPGSYGSMQEETQYCLSSGAKTTQRTCGLSLAATSKKQTTDYCSSLSWTDFKEE